MSLKPHGLDIARRCMYCRDPLWGYNANARMCRSKACRAARRKELAFTKPNPAMAPKGE